jgi:prefoldin subunit 5
MPEQYRLSELERRLQRIEDSLNELLKGQAVVEERMKSVSTKAEKLEEDVKGLNKTLIGFGVTVTAGAIGFAITTTQFFG